MISFYMLFSWAIELFTETMVISSLSEVFISVSSDGNIKHNISELFPLFHQSATIVDFRLYPSVGFE